MRLFRPEEICFLLYWAIGLSLWLGIAAKDYQFNFKWGVDLIPAFALLYIVAGGLRGRVAGAVTAARDWFGIWSASVSYLALHGMVFLVNPHPADDALMATDRMLFGGDPSMRLQWLIRPALTRWCDFFYTLYALYPVALLGFLYSRGPRARGLFHRASLGFVMTLYLGYLGYILVPARGPLHTLATHYTVPLRPSGVSQEAFSTFEMFRYSWDCFPSLHTACSLLMLIYAFEYSLVLGAFLVGPVTITIFSCLYLRYHYGIDILAGIALALGVWRLVGPIRRRWDDASDQAACTMSHPPAAT